MKHQSIQGITRVDIYILYRQSCPQKVIICLSFSKAEEKTVRSQPEEDQRNQAAKLTGLRTSHNISETKTARRFRSPKAKKLSNPEIRKTNDLQLPATQQTKQQGKQQEDTRNQEPRHPETKNQKPKHEETKQPGNRATQKPRTPGTWNQKTRNQGIQKPKITATQKPRNSQKPRKPKNKPRKPQKPETQKPGIKESRTIVHSKMTKIPHPKMNLLAFWDDPASCTSIGQSLTWLHRWFADSLIFSRLLTTQRTVAIRCVSLLVSAGSLAPRLE